MKKGTLLNAELSRIIAKLGHTDQLAIGDAGLPIPDVTERLDLALIAGVPSFMQVVGAVTQEMQIERAILATEIAEANPAAHQQVLDHIQQIAQLQGKPVAIEYVPHEAFKAQTRECKAVVRTGECSPYANIILCSGVVF